MITHTCIKLLFGCILNIRTYPWSSGGLGRISSCRCSAGVAWTGRGWCWRRRWWRRGPSSPGRGWGRRPAGARAPGPAAPRAAATLATAHAPSACADFYAILRACSETTPVKEQNIFLRPGYVIRWNRGISYGAFHLLGTHFYMLSGPPPPFLHVIRNINVYRILTPPPLLLGAYVINGRSLCTILRHI